ncbi:hypothetical protein [Maribacter hydrothermalis]|nr:hypothetical protein [Maribacter hydrothermalis]
MFDYGIDTYKSLTKVVKLKFNSELKDSGIELQGIYSMKNLVTEKEFYLLEVNGKQIRFANQKSFVVLFSDFLKSNIKELKNRYNYLLNRTTDEFSDDIGIEMEYKQADYYSMKQTELLKKMIEFNNKM